MGIEIAIPERLDLGYREHGRLDPRDGYASDRGGDPWMAAE